jgi:2-amino-4-hydroxy-6-hydroxymethyldihydropteridine diphosphokinase
MAIAYVGLGSNIGERAQHLAQACATLDRHPAIEVSAVSSLYHTAPLGYTDQAWFLNAVVQLHTSLHPHALLAITQATERRLGRVATFRWGPRVIDIDILLYEALQLRTPYLSIPHVALQERAFVLVPLAEIAPHVVLPSGRTVRELLHVSTPDESIRRVGPFPAFTEGVCLS